MEVRQHHPGLQMAQIMAFQLIDAGPSILGQNQMIDVVALQDSVHQRGVAKAVERPLGLHFIRFQTRRSKEDFKLIPHPLLGSLSVQISELEQEPVRIVS